MPQVLTRPLQRSVSGNTLLDTEANGILYKHTTGTLKRWAPRHFKLTKDTFSYSHTKTSAPTWQIKCSEIQNVGKASSTELEITQTNGEVIILRAADEDTLNYWTRNIESRIQSQWSKQLNKCIGSSSALSISSLNDLTTISHRNTASKHIPLKTSASVADGRSLSNIRSTISIENSTDGLYNKLETSLVSSKEKMTCIDSPGSRISTATLGKTNTTKLKKSISTGLLQSNRANTYLNSGSHIDLVVTSSQASAMGFKPTVSSRINRTPASGLSNSLLSIYSTHSHGVLNESCNNFENPSNGQALPLKSTPSSEYASLHQPLPSPTFPKSERNIPECPPISIIPLFSDENDQPKSSQTNPESLNTYTSNEHEVLDKSMDTAKTAFQITIAETPLGQRNLNDIFLELLMQMMQLRINSTELNSKKASMLLDLVSKESIEIVSRIQKEILYTHRLGLSKNDLIEVGLQLSQHFLDTKTGMDTSYKKLLDYDFTSCVDSVTLNPLVRKELIHKFYLSIDCMAQAVEKIMAFFNQD
ncbi:hypothetical protein MT418_001206 [Batrachochytrium dendrobatidis]